MAVFIRHPESYDGRFQPGRKPIDVVAGCREIASFEIAATGSSSRYKEGPEG